MSHVRFGFAAGVGLAAVALPRRRGAFLTWGYALSAAFGPVKPEGLSPDEGHSPGNNRAVVGAASRRLKSGGIAVATQMNILLRQGLLMAKRVPAGDEFNSRWQRHRKLPAIITRP